jgi:hypothetical protein
MANASGTRTEIPQPPSDEPRILPALGPDPAAPRQQTELEVQASADVIDDDVKKRDKKEKLFPVRLLKKYRPIGDFEIGQPDPENGKPYRSATEEEKALGVQAGVDVLLPVEEAKRVIALKIGERNDPIK